MKHQLDTLRLSRASDPETSHLAEEVYKDSRKHLSHAQQILFRLLLGPATARDLSAIALKYTGRVSDLRKLGHRIDYDGGKYYLRVQPVQAELGL